MKSDNKCRGHALRIVIGIVVTISFMVGGATATPASGWWNGSQWDLKFLVSESGDSIESYTITVPCSVPWPPYFQYRSGGPIQIIDNTFNDGHLEGTFSDSINEASGSYFSGSGCFNLIYWDASPMILGILGDIDGDEYITASDALLYLRYAVGQNIAPYHMDESNDVTCDGNIFADDALLVLRKAVGQNVDLECPKP